MNELRDSLPYRMGVLRGALLERIRQADQLLAFADRLESLANQDSAGAEQALDELQTLAGIGKRKEERK